MGLSRHNLVKPFGIAELLARLRALQRRSPQLQPQHLQVGHFVLDYATSTIAIAQGSSVPQVIPLTAKEFQILEHFMRHPNQLFTRDQLMRLLLTYLYADANLPSN